MIFRRIAAIYKPIYVLCAEITQPPCPTANTTFTTSAAYYTNPSTDPQGVQVIVTDPMGTSLLKKNLDRAGRFAFTATQGGEHVLCLSTNNTKWFGVPKEFVCVSFSLRWYNGPLSLHPAACLSHLRSSSWPCKSARKLLTTMKSLSVSIWTRWSWLSGN